MSPLDDTSVKVAVRLQSNIPCCRAQAGSGGLRGPRLRCVFAFPGFERVYTAVYVGRERLPQEGCVIEFWSVGVLPEERTDLPFTNKHLLVGRGQLPSLSHHTITAYHGRSQTAVLCRQNT